MANISTDFENWTDEQMADFAARMLAEIEDMDVKAGHAERALIVAIEDAIRHCGYHRTQTIIKGELDD